MCYFIAFLLDGCSLFVGVDWCRETCERPRSSSRTNRDLFQRRLAAASMTVNLLLVRDTMGIRPSVSYVECEGEGVVEVSSLVYGPHGRVVVAAVTVRAVQRAERLSKL